MNRNVESHFSQVPSLLNVRRSTMRIPFEHKTSFNIGSIIPFFAEEVLAGDSWRLKTSKVVRLQTLLNPIMSNIYLDTYYFFVPFRLVWEHWKNLFGENTDSAWIPQVEYTTPQMDFESYISSGSKDTVSYLGVQEKTLADYFGMPTGVDGLSMSALYARAYHIVWSEFFRDQALQDPLNVYKGDNKRTVPNVNNPAYDTPEELCYLDERYPWPRLANRYHDYFSSALPNAQRGNPVEIPVNLNDAEVPVGTSAVQHDLGSYIPLYAYAYATDHSEINGYLHTATALNDSTRHAYVDYYEDTAETPSFKNTGIYPNNLWADLGYYSGNMSINVESLRQANMLQHMLEVDALGGGRMRELLRSHFGVISPDSRLQVPEYLGGNRISLTVHEVVNQSEGENAFLGNLGAMSHTSDVHYEFTHSFTEPGICLGLAVARYDNSFYQGIPRKFSRSGRYSYYWPSLAGLGSQAILNKEIYAQGPSVKNPDTNVAYDDEVFGYSEAWAEYRYGTPNLITSEMRPNSSNSLASWHLSDNYDSMPYLSAEWIAVDKDIPDRVLAVSSEVADQIFADFYVENICTRVMPLYSIPGMYNYF